MASKSPPLDVYRQSMSSVFARKETEVTVEDVDSSDEELSDDECVSQSSEEEVEEEEEDAEEEDAEDDGREIYEDGNLRSHDSNVLHAEEVDSENDDEDSPSRQNDRNFAEKSMAWKSFFNNGRYFKCACRRNCTQRFSMGSAYDLLYDMWHDTPRAWQRRARMHEHLRKAWDSHKKVFVFKIDGMKICEMAYRAVLGLSYQTTMWKGQKTLVSCGGDLGTREPARKRDSYRKKFDAMRRWIQRFAEKSCDRLPVNRCDDGILYVVPFMTVPQFAAEYFLSDKNCGGSEKTFRRAFKSCEHIRTMRCKGNFSTCGICDIASKMLANVHGKKRLSELQKEVR
jgi:hypothetical protein